MADYSGTRAVHAKTLAANASDKVTLAGDWQYVTFVGHNGTDKIYYRVHETDADAVVDPATVAGDGTRVIPAAVAMLDIHTPAPSATIITLISPGSPTYSIQAPEPGVWAPRDAGAARYA